MKKKIIFSAILVLIFIGSGIYFISKKPKENIKISEGNLTEQDIPEINNQPVIARVECHDSPKYFIISRPSGVSVNDDYLIKYKKTEDQSILCEYFVEETDFEIKDIANGFIAIENNFLIIKTGTGPDNTYLMVFDLNNRKKVYGDINTGIESIKENILTYWHPNYDLIESVPSPTKKNCTEFYDKYDEYIGDGLGFVMNSLLSVNLVDLTKKELGKYKCSVTQ